MAQIAYRGNLSAAIFPMTLADAGRTVIAPQADQNFDRRVDPAGEQKDAGIPQAIYMENVLPTANGYQSVGYIPGDFSLPKTTGLITIIRTFDPYNSFVSGNVYPIFIAFYDDNTIRWKEAAVDSIWKSSIIKVGAYNFASVVAEDISVALVRGTCYLWNKVDLFQIDFTAITLTFTNLTASLTGVTVTDIQYITGSYNYLILVNSTGLVQWSSTTTPTDFTTSLITGAGSETPNAYSGIICFAHSTSFGFYIYSSTTVIAAQYTGNSRYPFKFIEVSNSGAYNSQFQLGFDNNSALVYSFDNTGKLTLLDNLNASPVAPEASTFLERSRYTDTFDYATNTFSVLNIAKVNNIRRRIFYLVDRYALIAYGPGTTLADPYKYVLVYDTLLQRYGRLKLDFHYILCDETNIQFVNYITGAINSLCFDIYDTNAVFQSALLLGKFQYIRSRNIKLEEIEFESGQDASRITQNFSLVLFPSLDGKNFNTPVVLTPTFTYELITANTHKTARNHSLMLKGAFDVNTVQLKFTIAGDR
jgi:hypothetical protein